MRKAYLPHTIVGSTWNMGTQANQLMGGKAVLIDGGLLALMQF
jgi:hypothetical protein